MPRTISVKFSGNDLDLISRAASLCRRAPNDFIREAALREAEAALLERPVIRMSAEQFEAFKAIVAAPAKAVPEIVQRLRRSSPWEEN